MKHAVALLVLHLFALLLRGQEPVITRFIPGNYRFDNVHRIELFNPGNQTLVLGGYMVVTRDYSVLLPTQTRLAPKATLVLVKKAEPGEQNVVELSRTADFLIRFPLREYEGNYAAVFNRNRRLADAFFYSPAKDVPFLPDSDTCITQRGEKIPFNLPMESDPAWEWLRGRDDPVIAYSRTPEGWKITSRRSAIRAITEYRNVTLRYQDGIVMVKWTTPWELAQARAHVIERSSDQLTFTEVGRVDATPGSNEIRQYEFFDPEVKTGNVYYYRLRNPDSPGKELLSDVKEIRAEEGQEEFSMEAFFSHPPDERELNVRLYSGYSQRLRIKVLDARFREVAVIFDGYVNARSRTLVKLHEALPPGTYRILAETETKRYAREVRVE